MADWISQFFSESICRNSPFFFFLCARDPKFYHIFPEILYLFPRSFGKIRNGFPAIVWWNSRFFFFFFLWPTDEIERYLMAKIARSPFHYAGFSYFVDSRNPACYFKPRILVLYKTNPYLYWVWEVSIEVEVALFSTAWRWNNWPYSKWSHHALLLIKRA